MNTLGEFNSLQPQIKFAMEEEEEANNKIHYLDLNITRKQNQYIFHKPTTTD
jgi:hypothetical protein